MVLAGLRLIAVVAGFDFTGDFALGGEAAVFDEGAVLVRELVAVEVGRLLFLGSGEDGFGIEDLAAGLVAVFERVL